MSPSNLVFELLKAKDRSRLPPISLLQNDAKDLVWIPQYINEKNEFHLQHRFEPDTEGERKPLPRNIPHDWWYDGRGGSEIYVFGANSNNHLGVGDSTDRSTPCKLSHADFQDPVFVNLSEMLEKPRFRTIKFSKYHSVAVTLDGRVFSCGLGSWGRLGQGNAVNLFRFKPVDFLSDVRQISVSNNHTLVLTFSNKIFAWGQNSYNQLGFTSISSNSFKDSRNGVYENSPKEVNTGDLRKSLWILGIETSKIHSVAFTSDSLFFWGLNIGQMGMVPEPGSSPTGQIHEHRINGVLFKGTIIPQPKEISFRDNIKLVATCESCTCVVTEVNDIYVFYMNQRLKLPKLPARAFSEKQFDCFKPSRLTSAPVIKKISMKSPENVHILLENGDVMSFAIGSADLKNLRNVRFNYLWKAYDSDMRAVDIDNSYDGSVIVCTKNGSVFAKYCLAGSSQRRGSMAGATMPTIPLTSRNKFKKVENVNRVVRVACDDSFSSFGLIRDDIDALPLKLQKNDFFKDLEYLSVLVEPDLYRKQDQLLDVDHDLNSYVSDYFYPSMPFTTESSHKFFLNSFAGISIEDDEDEYNEALSSTDGLRRLQACKFEYSKNLPVLLETMYQYLGDADIAPLMNILKSESDVATQILIDNPLSSEKYYDGQIRFCQHTDLVIGFHTQILEHRSSFCRQIFHPTDPGEYFIHDGIEGSYDPEFKTLSFKSEVDLRAVVILLHFIYTNNVLSVWDMYPTGLKCPTSIRKVKTDFNKLMTLFRLDSLNNRKDAFVGQLQSMVDGDGDVLVSLKGGQQLCMTSILVARSAFFETILSERWDTGDLNGELSGDEGEVKLVSLEDVTPVQFRIILKHLHGCNDLDVFEEALPVVAETRDSDDFVNFLLEMIEISDELLLVQLKHLCELAIKEFINLDNVLILLAHAHWLNARKLFMNCCWYIFNNLEIVLFDGSMRDLDSDLLQKLEKQIRFFQKCKLSDFVTGKHGEINEAMCTHPLEETAEKLVHEFVAAPNDFDDLFMSDRKGFSSFEPLLDIKLEAGSEEGKRRLSSRRMSRKGSIEPPILELRSLSLANKSLERRISESAVADDEEFELVTTRRRKSKADAKSPEEPKSLDLSLRPSRDGSTSPSSQIATALAGWSSRNSSSLLVSAPVLGESSDSRRRTKIKFAPPMKLSQKQRRKVAQEPEPESASNVTAPLPSPWKLTSVASSSSSLGDLPVLGSLVPKKEAQPRLTAIILQESTRNEEKRIQESQRRTLHEVQQEQEFAKWWEEESKRVQMEQSQDGVNGHKGRRRKRGGK